MIGCGMSCSNSQPEYLVLQSDYVNNLRSAYELRIQELQRSASKQLAGLQKKHDQALLDFELQLLEAKGESARLRELALSWRIKHVKCLVRLESSEEDAQLAQANIANLELALQGLTAQRGKLMFCYQASQEQVQSLTALCQTQHRAKVAQQGQLVSTDAEVKQLHAQLLQSNDLAEQLRQRLEGEQRMVGAIRAQAEELKQQLSMGQAELRAHASAYAALKGDRDSLQASLAEEKRLRAGLDMRISILSSELQACGAELKAGEQRVERATTDRVRQEELMQEFQRRRTADAVLIQELEQGVERMKELLEQQRRDTGKELSVLRVKLEQEQVLRESLERKCEEKLKAQDEQLKARLAEREAAAREQARQLEASQYERRLLQLQTAHATELETLQARIRELEREIAIITSPDGVQPEKVQQTKATIDELIGKLGGGIGEDGDEDSPGPPANFNLGMSQPHFVQNRGKLQMTASDPERTAPVAPLSEAATTADVPGNALDEGTLAGGAAGTAKIAGKRALKSSADEGCPAGRRRACKAAKLMKAVDDAEPPAAAPVNPDNKEVPAQADGGPATRNGSRRRAAQSGQARTKAMAVALTDDSESEAMIETPGVEVKGVRTRGAARRARTVTAGAADPVEDVVEGPKHVRPAAGRSRAAKAANGGKPQGQLLTEPDPGMADKQPEAAGRAAELNPRLVSQVVGNSMPRPELHENTNNGRAAEALPNFSQLGMPTASQVSFFGSFKDLDTSKGRNPLATLNQKVLEHARGRARIVPLTSIQQWKIGMSGAHKNAGGQQLITAPTMKAPPPGQPGGATS
ncbi:hypothetical protein Vafri_1538 [Volvox africanus]|nr:hypothetical protein Vafri_1538 [Volvox africanus]